jgi:hypothetical protein
VATTTIAYPGIGEQRAHGEEAKRGTKAGGRWPEAHARSGDPIAIAACLGDGDAFDTSVTDFAQRYADQNERDYRQFVKAIRSGRMAALEGV